MAPCCDLVWALEPFWRLLGCTLAAFWSGWTIAITWESQCGWAEAAASGGVNHEGSRERRTCSCCSAVRADMFVARVERSAGCK